MKKGKEKRRKITLKKGEKALKMLLFGLKTQKKFTGGGLTTPSPQAAANLFVGEKISKYASDQ